MANKKFRSHVVMFEITIERSSKEAATNYWKRIKDNLMVYNNTKIKWLVEPEWEEIENDNNDEM